MNAITPDLIKAAKNWQYLDAEGFLDELPVAMINLTDDQKEKFTRHAAELSESSGVEHYQAEETIINLALVEYLSRLS